MRRLTVTAVTILLVLMVPVAVEGIDAGGTTPADQWTEPSVLCYYSNSINHVETIYVKSGEPIGAANIPELTGQVHYWVRMDTGEVVTVDTVFEPGTYVIKAYTVAPVPWGKETASSEAGMNYTNIAIFVMIAVLGAAVIYLYIKK